MAKDIIYETVNFKRLSNTYNDSGDVKLLADVALSRGVTHKHKMLRYIKNTIIVAAVAITILFRYTMVADNTTKISRLEKEFTEISEANISLQCEIDSCTDSDTIEEAAGKLGMSQPSKSQKITVDVLGGDYVEVAKTENKGQVGGSEFYATMIETLGNVLEYLY